MPSAFAARMMRTAISPRLATNSVLIGIARSDVEVVERLAGHYRVLVLHMERQQATGDLRNHRHECLHHLDEPNGVANRDIVALSLELRLIGCRFTEEGARNGGLERLAHHDDLPQPEDQCFLERGAMKPSLTKRSCTACATR